MLRRFRDCVLQGTYVVTSHAEEEMTADGYTIPDVERGVLTGAILEKQQDRQTGESKYRLRGGTDSRGPIELVAKLGPTGNMVVITVYAP